MQSGGSGTATGRSMAPEVCPGDKTGLCDGIKAFLGLFQFQIFFRFNAILTMLRFYPTSQKRRNILAATDNNTWPIGNSDNPAQHLDGVHELKAARKGDRRTLASSPSGSRHGLKPIQMLGNYFPQLNAPLRRRSKMITKGKLLELT